MLCNGKAKADTDWLFDWILTQARQLMHSRWVQGIGSKREAHQSCLKCIRGSGEADKLSYGARPAVVED